MRYKIKNTLKKFVTTAITLSGLMTAAGMSLSTESAQALNITFGTTDFTVTGLAGSNNATKDILINTRPVSTAATPSLSGFGNFFTNNFILLGANTNSDSITDATFTNGNSTATSLAFDLDAASVANPITIAFNWAFRGNASGSGTNADNFNISLIKTDQSEEATFFSRTAGTASNRYGDGNSATVSIDPADFSLTPGQYQIVISVNENTGAGNSAAGFNNISFSAASVPFGFSTNASLVVFGGVFYGFHKLRRKTALKKYQE